MVRSREEGGIYRRRGARGLANHKATLAEFGRSDSQNSHGCLVIAILRQEL